MANTKDEMAWHGSKLCMQICVNNENRKRFLDESLGLGCIEWFSPLAKDNYKEYLLKDFANENPDFNIPDNVIKKLEILKSHWDGIGRTEDGTLVLVEAKAHTDELEQGCNATSESSIRQIKELIFDIVDADKDRYIDVWYSQYYQLANRLTYLKNLLDAGVKVKLVYLYFVDDVSYKPESYEKWKQYDEIVKSKLKLNLPQYIGDNWIHLYLDIWKSQVYK